MVNVIIDPRMLALTDENLIGANLSFYTDVLKLVSLGIIRICIYDDMEKLLEGAYDDQGHNYPPPFPINLSIIPDRILREACRSINHLFVSCILDEGRTACRIEIDDCTGEQRSQINEPYSRDFDLCNLQFYLLTECYLNKTSSEKIDRRILSGKLPDGAMIRPLDLELCCSCDDRQDYHDSFQFVWPDRLFASVEVLKTELRDCLLSEGIGKNTPVLILDGDHHCHIQRKRPDNYRGLTKQNRLVLKHLEYFGLKTVHLRDTFPSDGVTGTIRITPPVEMESDVFISGMLVGEENNAAHVQLEFPERVASLLLSILGDTWTEQAVRSLKNQVIP